jgi:hypothetical protein
LHGPLQNAFETYDERDPNYIPGVGKEFLKKHGISETEIMESLLYLPRNVQGENIWNSCVAVYAYIMNIIQKSRTPIVGVVERAHVNGLFKLSHFRSSDLSHIPFYSEAHSLPPFSLYLGGGSCFL